MNARMMMIMISVLDLYAVPAVIAAERGTRYEPAWESLERHQNPAWFRDAKLGIYTHWGPVTLGSEDCPKGGQWYGSEMYNPKSQVFKHHRQKFGDQEKFGYKDLFPLFTAPKFDPEQWAELFLQAGARFAGPVAVHHDNYALWDSSVTPWNSVKTGPKRDITGELAKAIRKRGMKFITTFHHGWAWEYYKFAHAYDGADPAYLLLYGEPHNPGEPPSTPSGPPAKRYCDQWLNMVNEVLEKYQPDLIWFDFGLGRLMPPEYQRRMFADYYNWGLRVGKETGVAHKHRDIFEHTGILDFERGREDKLVPYPWLTDTSVGPWFCQNSTPYRSADNLIDVFVDIVSKNGCMLLNVGPRADGSIPEEAIELLLALGRWLKLNGEAIYGSRPWERYGEGHQDEKGGGFTERNDPVFTDKDIRFTTQGPILYAILLGWPEDGIAKITSLARGENDRKLSSVRLLGHNGTLEFTRDAQALKVTLPQTRPCEHAYTLKIE